MAAKEAAERFAPRPGGPSAKTFHRAGSPNHQDDSKENHMVLRQGSVGRDQFGGGVR
jgi:hypothetical protein